MPYNLGGLEFIPTQVKMLTSRAALLMSFLSRSPGPFLISALSSMSSMADVARATQGNVGGG